MITAVFTAILSILIGVIGLNVSRLRIKLKISLGDGENKQLRGAIRAHGNAVEHIPIVLLMFLLYELQGGATVVLWSVGTIFTLGRIGHAYGLITHTFWLRRTGAAITFATQILLPVLLLADYLA